MPYLQTERATLWHARAEEVYPLIDPGSCSMAWVDGPYAMRKAPWDMMNVDDLPAFYAPHYEALDRVLAPSATVYHWGTAEGWARVDPVIRGMGWTFRVLVTWNKTNPPSQQGQDTLTAWADLTEVCGVYQRAPDWSAPLRHAVARAPLSRAEICRRIGIDSRLLQFWEDGERFPGVDLWARVVALLEVVAPEYDLLRPVFTAPTGHTGNVWTAPMVPPSRRLKTTDGETHECEKPLTFADRAIRASTRPGDTVIDPFAGTNRCALVCRRLPAEEARHTHGIEMDARWLDAIRPSLVADYAHVPKGQAALFGTTGAAP